MTDLIVNGRAEVAVPTYQDGSPVVFQGAKGGKWFCEHYRMFEMDSDWPARIARGIDCEILMLHRSGRRDNVLAAFRQTHGDHWLELPLKDGCVIPGLVVDEFSPTVAPGFRHVSNLWLTLEAKYRQLEDN